MSRTCNLEMTDDCYGCEYYGSSDIKGYDLIDK